MGTTHTFAIPAFGRPQHLSACIESILHQSRRSDRVVLSTSTPSQFLRDVAEKYDVEMLVNPCRTNIATDWNFALAACQSDLVTIAHQDDIYDKNYVETMCDAVRRHPDALIAFSDFAEHTPSGPRATNLNVRIKRALCARAFGRKEAIGAISAKCRLLTLGNPVCCPSVVINRKRLPKFNFSEGLKTNLDWEAWARMAQMPGDFVYIRKALISKGVHPQSETSVTIANRSRELEDRRMFEQFWPAPVAALILSVYKLGYLANRV
jgi:glycosyltransferase involved in cell wall biosynthesis